MNYKFLKFEINKFYLKMIINKIFNYAQKLLPNLEEKIGAPITDEQIELLKKASILRLILYSSNSGNVTMEIILHR